MILAPQALGTLKSRPAWSFSTAFQRRGSQQWPRERKHWEGFKFKTWAKKAFMGSRFQWCLHLLHKPMSFTEPCRGLLRSLKLSLHGTRSSPRHGQQAGCRRRLRKPCTMEFGNRKHVTREVINADLEIGKRGFERSRESQRA